MTKFLLPALAAGLILAGCESLRDVFTGSDEPTIDVPGVPFPVLVSEARGFCPEAAGSPEGAASLDFGEVVEIVQRVRDTIQRAEALRADLCEALAEYDEAER